jgi:undecaprenyl-diphosphatase
MTGPRALDNIATPVSRRELSPILLLGAAATAALVLLALAAFTTGEGLPALDRRLLLALRDPNDLTLALGPSWLRGASRDVTGLGGGTVVTLAVGVAALFLTLVRRIASAGVLLLSVGGAVLVERLLKGTLGRARPDLSPLPEYVTTMSFPSGHATMAAAAYLSLGAILAHAQPRRRLKAVVGGTAVLLVLLIGMTRVHLAAACWAALLLVEQRRAVTSRSN